jgi:signal transduction histidine kinase
VGSRLSIRARIALFGSLVVALTLCLFGLLVYALAAYGGASDRDTALRKRAEETATSLASADPAVFAPRPIPAPVDVRSGSEIFVAIVGADGAPIAATGELDGASPPVPPDLLGRAADGPAKGTYSLADDLDVRLYAVPWIRPDLGLSGWVVAGQSTQRLKNDLNGILAFLVVSAIISLAAAFGASWRVAGRALRPLRTMARTADEIGATEDMSRRLPVLRPRDEIGRLSASFNGMLARLEEAHGRLAAALDREQRFVADASHELRTPLTSIRTNADFLLGHPEARPDDRRAALADIATESERMGALVHDLLTLARADAGQHLDRDERNEVDLLVLLEDVRRQARRLHPDREVNLVTEPEVGPGAATVCGDAAALRQLVWILVDNALTHGGATARIWLCLGLRDGVAGLRVADDGPGLPPADLERVFARFYQADPARSGGGTGLGLAIARWIAEEHGGRIWARNNDGPGASFFVELATCRAPSSPA